MQTRHLCIFCIVEADRGRPHEKSTCSIPSRDFKAVLYIHIYVTLSDISDSHPLHLTTVMHLASAYVSHDCPRLCSCVRKITSCNGLLSMLVSYISWYHICKEWSPVHSSVTWFLLVPDGRRICFYLVSVVVVLPYLSLSSICGTNNAVSGRDAQYMEAMRGWLGRRENDNTCNELLVSLLLRLVPLSLCCVLQCMCLSTCTREGGV